MDNKEIDEIIDKEKNKQSEREEQEKRKAEAQERERKDHIIRRYLEIAARVTDTTPEKDREKMKRIEREVLDAIIDSFKTGYRDGYDSERGANRGNPNMVMDNLMASFKDMSDEQLKHFKKTYETHTNKLMEDKVKKGRELTSEEVKILEVYREVQKEIQRRIERENNNQQEDKNEKGKGGR